MGLSSKQVSVDIHNWPQGGLEFPKPERREENQNAPLLKCPRCESANTKFCYYNNYSRSQPRHFCRACRRHWTEGGTLRNIPVGGGRKNKRRKIAPTTTSSAGAASRNPTATVIQEMECPIFPDILRQVLPYPPPPPESPTVDAMNGLFPSSLPNNSLTFMQDFNGVSPGFVLSEGKNPFTAAASSCSFSSQYSWMGAQDVGGGCEDGLLGMDPSTASTWAKKETVSPASYWDFADGAAADFNDADVVEPVLRSDSGSAAAF